MKLLWGIQGTGNGHIRRSNEVISELKRSGFDVDILISGNFNQLEISHEIKWKMKGFSFKRGDSGQIDYLKTFIHSDFRQFLKDIRLDISKYDKIITDFEPITAWAGKIKSKEVIGLSNQNSFLSKKLPRPKNSDQIAEFILKNFAPCRIPIGLHYREWDDFIFKPIIKSEYIQADFKNCEYYLVYLPNINLETQIFQLTKYRKFRFKIFSPWTDLEFNYRNCEVFPISKKFSKYFLEAQGVITTAGFETTSETIWANKKLFIIPEQNQWEQMCNAHALREIGFDVGNLDNLENFLNNETIKLEKWENPINRIINIISN